MYLVIWYSENEDHCELHSTRGQALQSFGGLFQAGEDNDDNSHISVKAVVYQISHTTMTKIASGCNY